MSNDQGGVSVSGTAEDIERNRDIMETWEIQVKGGCRVLVFDRRDGKYRQMRLHGEKGPRRITLSRDDRIYNQENVRDDYKHLDPFANGALAQVVEGQLVGITDDDLREMLQVIDEFEDLVSSIDNELTARRLLTIAEREGRMDQVNALRDHIDENWRVGGTQPTVEEMLQESEAGEKVS